MRSWTFLAIDVILPSHLKKKKNLFVCFVVVVVVFCCCCCCCCFLFVCFVVVVVVCQAHRCGAFNGTTYIQYNNMFTFIHTLFCL